MKKYLYLLLIFILFPSFINASNIKNIEINGNKESNYANEFKINVNINFEGLNSINENNEGIVYLEYDLSYDGDILNLNEIENTDFVVGVTKKNSIYHVTSYIKSLDEEIVKPKNACSFDLLYCSNYTDVLKFIVIKNDNIKTNIEVKNVVVKLIDYNEFKEEYTKNDIIEITSKVNGVYSINIKKSSDTLDNNKVKDIFKNKISIPTIKLPREKELDNVPKSSNTNIESIKISKYDIDFDKEQLEYELEVEENVNKLNIEVILEDTRSTYTIIGNDDLNFYGNKVKIQVVAEDNSKKEYIINVIKKRKEIIDTSKEIKDNVKDKIKSIKNNKKIIAIISICIALIIILSIIVSKTSNKKIDKFLDKL